MLVQPQNVDVSPYPNQYQNPTEPGPYPNPSGMDARDMPYDGHGFVGSYAGISQGQNFNEQLTDTTEILKNIDLFLRGIKKVRNPITKKIEEKRGKAVMPDYLVDELMAQLNMRFNSQTPYGFLPPQRVHQMAKDFGIELTNWFCNQFYALKYTNKPDQQMDKKSLSMVIVAIHDLYFIHLTRATEGRTQDGIMGVNSMRGEYGMDPYGQQSPPPSLLGRVAKRFGWGG